MDRIPILKLGDALLVSVQVDMHDRLAKALEEDLTSKIIAAKSKGVLIDISGLDIVDSFIGRMLDTIAAVIVNDAATRLEFRAALCEPYDYKRPEQPACNKETNNISHGVP